MHQLLLTSMATASALLAACPSALSAPRFNDSALTHCVVNAKLTTDCTTTGQDAEYGRDVKYPSDRNGRAGFSFVKLDGEGNRLPISAASWTCVEDRITGLVWEVKENAGQLRSGSDRYPYHDAVRFIRALNNQGLCGFKDWRLPDKNEADTLASMALTGASTAEGLDRAFFDDAAAVSWTRSCSIDWCYATPFYGDSGGRCRDEMDSIRFAPCAVLRSSPEPSVTPF